MICNMSYKVVAMQYCPRRSSVALTATLSVLTSILGAAGCNKAASGQASRNSDGRPLVVCTTTMIADLAHNVGGDRIRVEGIMPPGTDPHIYEPKPTDTVLFRRAALVLYNGLYLEGKMEQMIENAGTRAVALAEDPRIKPRESTIYKGAPDPHCWWNPRHFMIYAERTRDALIQVDPAGADDYRRRTDEYLSLLAEMDANVHRVIEEIPLKHRYLITSHDAFFYYGQAYGLKVDAVLGISTDASVRAVRIDELARLTVRRGIPAIFHETSVSAALNEMINRVVELAAKQGHTVRIPHQPLYSDSLGLPGTPADTYLGALAENTRIVVSALSGKPINLRLDSASPLSVGADSGQVPQGTP